MEWNLRTIDTILLDLELSDYTDFLIDGLVSSSVTTILGDAYVGKTYMALDIARSLTTGAPFLGHSVIRQVDRVAFLCTDPGASINLAKRAKSIDPRRVLAQQFYPPQTWDEWREAVSLFARERIGAIVIDNTTDIAGDANDPREVKKITDGLRLWSDNGATILNLHHRNKVRGYFGSSLWRKWTRAELELSGSVQTHNRRLKSVANDATPIDLRLNFNHAASPAFTIVGADNNSLLVAWVKANPGLSQRQAADMATKDLGFKVSQSMISRAKNS
jgi:hypothetical protein